MKKHTTLKKIRTISLILILSLFLIMQILAFYLWYHTTFFFQAMLIMGLSFLTIPLFLVADVLYIRHKIKKMDASLQPKMIAKFVGGSRYFTKPEMLSIFLQYFLGQYQDVVSYSFTALHQPISQKKKIFFIFMMANCYFVVGDFEKLSSVCDAFEKENDTTDRFITQKMLAYRAFLNRNTDTFHSAIAICREYKGIFKTYVAMDLQFTEAVFLYHIGDKEKATAVFQLLVEKCPNLSFSALSKQYLQLDNSMDFSPFEKLTENSVSLMRNDSFAIIPKIILILLAVFMIFQSVDRIRQAYYLYQEDPRIGFSQSLDDYEILDSFVVKIDSCEPFALYIMNWENEITVFKNDSPLLPCIDDTALIRIGDFEEKDNHAFIELVTDERMDSLRNSTDPNILFKKEVILDGKSVLCCIYKEDKPYFTIGDGA